jgi:hypothetical protein
MGGRVLADDIHLVVCRVLLMLGRHAHVLGGADGGNACLGPAVIAAVVSFHQQARSFSARA